MPHTRSAHKRCRQNQRRRLRNRTTKSACKTQVKKFLSALKSGDIVKARMEYARASKLLDKAAARGVIHRNMAARRKSKLARELRDAASTAVTPKLKRAREFMARGESLFLRGDLERAEGRYAAAAQAMAGLQGGSLVELAAAMISHAQVLADLGRIGEARGKYRECLRLCHGDASPSSESLARFARTALSEMLRHEGRAAGASSSGTKQTRRTGTAGSPVPPDEVLSALSLPARGAFLASLGRHRDAEAVFRELLSKQEARRAPPSQLVQTLSNLGLALYKQDRIAEAEEFLRRAVDDAARFGLDQLPLPRRRRALVATAQAHERLSVCMMKAGRAEEASEIDELGRNRRFKDLLALNAGRPRAGSDTQGSRKDSAEGVPPAATIPGLR